MNWMITADGSGVNLDLVYQVSVQRRSTHEDLAPWYVLGRIVGLSSGTGVTLAQNFRSREAAVAWVAKHFAGDFDEDVDDSSLPLSDVVVGLCGNREVHEPHMCYERVGTFWCDADQSKRLPYAAEKRRAAKLDA